MALLHVNYFSQALNVQTSVDVIMPEVKQGIGVEASSEEALPKVLYRMGKVDRRQGNLLYIPMDTLFTIAAFWVADGLMASVSTTGLSLCILGFGTALITQPIKKDD